VDLLTVCDWVGQIDAVQVSLRDGAAGGQDCILDNAAG